MLCSKKRQRIIKYAGVPVYFMFIFQDGLVVCVETHHWKTRAARATICEFNNSFIENILDVPDYF